MIVHEERKEKPVIAFLELLLHSIALGKDAAVKHTDRTKNTDSVGTQHFTAGALDLSGTGLASCEKKSTAYLIRKMPSCSVPPFDRTRRGNGRDATRTIIKQTKEREATGRKSIKETCTYWNR